jgi:hypothetical protein
MDRDLVASGTTQIALGALSGWGLAALIAIPGLNKKLGVVDPIRLRQAHLDIIIMGGLVTAAGLVDDVPDWARHATRIGAWTNPLLFVPLAFDKAAGETKAYQAASVASFITTCAGWIGIAQTARRAARQRAH